MAKASKTKAITKKAPVKAAAKPVKKTKATKETKPLVAKPKAKPQPAAKKPAPKIVKKAEVQKTAKKTVTVKAGVKPVVAKPAPAKAPAIKATVKGKTTVAVTSPKPVETKIQAPAPKAEVKAPAKAAAYVSRLPLGKPAVKAAPAPIVASPEPKKTDKLDFTAGDFVVYPAHGVGYVEGVETQMIAGMEITLYTISFEKDRMRLKLPISKVKASGLRKLSSKDRLKDALSTLQGRSQVRRIMWSRRAQEYEAKINSGDPVAIAEVLRDLKKADDQGEQSYSERQIYQAALERLAREVAAIEKIDEKKAAEKLEAVLSNVA